MLVKDTALYMVVLPYACAGIVVRQGVVVTWRAGAK